MTSPAHITVAQAAAKWSISVSRVRQLRQQGRVAGAAKPGGIGSYRPMRAGPQYCRRTGCLTEGAMNPRRPGTENVMSELQHIYEDGCGLLGKESSAMRSSYWDGWYKSGWRNWKELWKVYAGRV